MSKDDRFQPAYWLAKIFAPLKRVPYLPILVDEQLKILTLFFRPRVFERMMDIVQWLRDLPGVYTRYHRFGGMEFRVENREICHIHGDGLVDIRLPRGHKNRVLDSSSAEVHHVQAQGDWVSYPITGKTDLDELKEVLQMTYDFRSGNSGPVS
ncbi:luciferase family protein [Pontibacter sp. G13]|uniref:luciferase domain-containing protein n=1 Tax=Pontibacter sp. G13 TaxID=3074898 RepID=UPI002889468D|nr:luciferase family protein [Pontibacter sp. G13]WNJ19058.1 DUF5519 family protein [Pontibacter sp. G13]